MLDFLRTFFRKASTGIRGSPGPWVSARRLTRLFLNLRRKPHGSVSLAQTPEAVLLLRLVFAAPSAARLRRRRNDVRNPRVIHFLIQRGQFLLGDFFDLRRSIVDQGRQLRELFFLVFAW